MTDTLRNKLGDMRALYGAQPRRRRRTVPMRPAFDESPIPELVDDEPEDQPLTSEELIRRRIDATPGFAPQPAPLPGDMITLDELRQRGQEERVSWAERSLAKARGELDEDE